MSHPKDRWERHLIGVVHGKRRADGYWGPFAIRGTEEEQTEFRRMAACLRRNTTKLCSCSMCGNPRHKEFKGMVRYTMQERRRMEKDSWDLSEAFNDEGP